MTVPGIGPLTATMIYAWVGDVRRSPHAKQLVLSSPHRANRRRTAATTSGTRLADRTHKRGIRPPPPRPRRPSLRNEVQFFVPGSLGGTRCDLAVYDVSGRRARTLFRGAADAGLHSIDWNLTGDDGARLRAGGYFLRLNAGDVHRSERVMVLPRWAGSRMRRATSSPRSTCGTKRGCRRRTRVPPRSPSRTAATRRSAHRRGR